MGRIEVKVNREALGFVAGLLAAIWFFGGEIVFLTSGLNGKHHPHTFAHYGWMILAGWLGPFLLVAIGAGLATTFSVRYIPKAQIRDRRLREREQWIADREKELGIR